MGRSAKLWENPLDFLPERFYNQPKPSPFVFTAFQAGPRICLGQNLALLEMKCALARMLIAFSFRLAQLEDSIAYLTTVSLPVDGGLKVFASRRASVANL